MSELYPYAKKGADNLRQNRIWLAQAEQIDAEETDHNPPSQGHYTAIYDWDEAAANTMSAMAASTWNLKVANGLSRVESLRYKKEHLYYLDAAKRGLSALVKGIDENGFLPNYRYIGKPRSFDPEMTLAFGSGATQSNYTQPPLIALSARQTYDAATLLDDNPKDFLHDIYPKIARHYYYFDRELSNGPDDKLVGIYHPHMTGRDSDPTFDSLKPLRIPRRGADTPKIIDKLNIPIDYASILWHGIRLRRAKGDTKKMRETYWMNDVMMNCIYVDNLHEATELAWETKHISDAWEFKDIALNVEQQILNRMWFPQARDGRGIFAGLDSNGEPIDEVSISNLFPLTLDNLREEQLESILNLMDESFNTPFPLPSVATDSPNYDPHNQESWRLWRGPKWMITDWYIVERGLWRQIGRTELTDRPDLIDRCKKWASRIAVKSQEVVENEGPCEHYDPTTGEGQRKAVVNFGWSNLAYFMRSSI